MKRIPPRPLLAALASLLTALSGCGNSATDDKAVGKRASAITAQPDPSCHYESYRGHDYWFCSAAQTWTAAVATCQSIGLTLTRIDDDAENTFVKGKLPADAFLGGYDRAGSGEYAWWDNNQVFWRGGATGAPVSPLYAHFAAGEPSGTPGSDCVGMAMATGQWADVGCDLARAFVCETNPTSGPLPQAPDTECTRATRGDSEYWSCANARSYDDARDHCLAQGMDLAEIADDAEADFVGGKIRVESFLGLSDRDQEGVWRWSASGELGRCADASRSPVDAYSHFAAGEPSRDNSCRPVVYGGKQYWVCDTSRYWLDAQSQCFSVGMKLAKIDSAGENAALAAAVKSDSWISGNDRDTEGSWLWGDGTFFWNGAANGSAPAGIYANWSSGQPDQQGNQDCAAMSVGGKWIDEPCTASVHPFICEGPAGSAQPDGRDCATVLPGQSWKAASCTVPKGYVCERATSARGPAALKTLSRSLRADHDRGGPRLTELQLRLGANVRHPFLADETALGLRACIDTVEPSGAAGPGPVGDQESLSYVQRFRGVRVLGGGYTVSRRTSDQVVVSATGSIRPAVNADVAPKITEADARTRALADIGAVPAAYANSPAGELVLVEAPGVRPPHWDLVWLFKLVPNGGSKAASEGYDVGVSAANGNVLMRSRRRSRLCNTTSLPPLDQPLTPATVDVLGTPQIVYGDPHTALVTQSPDPTNPFALFSRGVSSDTESPLHDLPIIGAMCGDDDSGKVVGLPSKSVTINANNPSETDNASAIYLALQTCVRVFAQEFENSSGGPFIGVDGVGEIPLTVRSYGPGILPLGPYAFDGIDNTLYTDNSFRPYPGAALDVACHELAHGIWYGFVGEPASVSLETRSLSEGFGDIMGALAEVVIRGTNAESAWCAVGDASSNGCGRDLANPAASTAGECHAKNGSGAVVRNGCPAAYFGPNYCRSLVQCPPGGGDQSSCCDEHTNSTVFSHWFYLVSHGSSGTNETGCAFQVAPLAPDPDLSAQLGAQIVFNALRDNRKPDLTYDDVASATISAAKVLFPAPGAPQVQTVVSAWYAVNVRENINDDTTAKVTPERGAKKVSPWVVFSWPVPAEETAWDFQIDDADFLGDAPRFEKDNITTVVTENGQRRAQFKLSMPANDERHFVWRVRPHESGAWRSCYAVHWFEGTGPKPVAPTPEVNGGRPATLGSTAVTWGELENTSIFGLYASKFANNCVYSDGVTERAVVTSTWVSDGVPGYFAEIPVPEPEAQYYVSLVAIGPLDRFSDNSERLSTCTTVSYKSAGLAPVYLMSPKPGAQFDYNAPAGQKPTFTFFDIQDATSKWTVRMYKRTASGDCGSTVAASAVYTRANCAGSSICNITTPENAFNLNWPGGYCWDVLSESSNGKKATSDKQAFQFYARPPATRTPGVVGEPKAQTATGALKNAWNKPVTFTWSAVPHAAKYTVRVWKWLDGFPDTSCGAGGKCYEPVTVVATLPATKRSYTVDDPQKVAQGRYCWQVQPILEDPTAPGSEAPVPALGHEEAPTCYTVGPSLPVIKVTQGPPKGGYSANEIKGLVHLDYVPDQQWDWTSETSPEVTWDPKGTWCTAKNPDYTDIVNCDRRFSIKKPKEGATYKIVVKAYNSAKWPWVKSDADLERRVEMPIYAGTCGARGEACCDGRKCDHPGADWCATDTNKCTCMKFYDPCSPGCGDQPDGCGGIVHCPCTGDDAVCDSTVVAGDDTPSDRTVSIGKTSGRIKMVIRTFDIKDNIRVLYDGVDFLDFGCIATNTMPLGCTDIPGDSVGGPIHYCCQAGKSQDGKSTIECSEERDFNGTASKMRVIVEPNCGVGEETKWEYDLQCPQ